jgi:hypothetical protein
LKVFSGRMYKVGLIRYVDVPAEISRALEASGAYLAVCGSVEGLPLRTTMVSRGNGCHRIAIHGDLRKKLRLDAGAVVEITLERDEESREPALPPVLVFALRNAPEARRVFRAMTTALRRQIVRHLTQAKRPETVERRVTRLVRRLEGMSQTKKFSKNSTSKRRGQE